MNDLDLDRPCYDLGDFGCQTFDIGDFIPIGANNGKLVIKQNNVVIGEFFADQSDETEVNIDLSAYATTADVEEDIETAKGEMQELIDAKASIAELEEEANLREEEDTRLAGEIDQLGTELNAEVNARTQADTTLTNAVNTKATITALTAETTNRENADNELQSQIDAITSQSDVVDIVGTYAQLQAYDTSHLGNNDIVKVLTDSTHDNAPSYFRWNKTAGTWNYVGSESVAYTKAEADDRFVPKTRTINGKALSANVTLTTNDLTNNSGYVKNTDYSTATTAGVVRDANCFLTSNENGGAYAEEMSYETYTEASDYNFIGKGTLENVITGKGLVKNTDYAVNNGRAGVVKVGDTYGIKTNTDGVLYAINKDLAGYNSAVGNLAISKGTLDNVLKGRKYLMPEYTLELPTTGEANKLYLTPAEQQPDVEATASGKDIELSDASEGDLIDWTIKGDTEQTSYTGKNLLYIRETMTTGGITFRNNGDGSITINGTSTGNAYFRLNDDAQHKNTLKAGKTYTLSVGTSDGKLPTNVRLYTRGAQDTGFEIYNDIYGSSTTNATKTIQTDVETFTLIGIYGAGVVLNNLTIYPMLEEGNSKTDFEPYVGGTASPSPDYPQEVKTVTGRQTVSVVGKNILNYVDGIIPSESGITNVINEDGTITTTGKPNKNYATIINYYDLTPFLEDGATYTISSTAYDNKTAVQVRRTAIADGSTYNWDTLSQAKTFTVDKSLYTYRMGILTNTMTAWGDSSLTITKGYQLEKNSSKTSFQPYSGQEVELNLGKNLFNNAKVANAMTGSTSGGITVTPIATGFTFSTGSGVSPNMSAGTAKLDDNFYTKIEPNTTYTLSFDTNFTTSGTFLIGYSYNASTSKHVKVIPDTNQTKVTFNIPYDNILLRFTSGTDVARTFSNIQLERGDKVTEYSPYFEPIELCKLGDYQDRIFKDGDTWKIEKNVGKSTFNGSENWFKSGASTEDIFVGALNIYDLGFRLPYVALYRQNIASNLGKQTSDTVVGGIDIYNQTSGFFAYVRTSGTTTYASDIATFKEKLAENNMQFYYLLTEPQVTEITYQPLIDQLNALETLATVKGYNRITTDTPSIQPFLEFDYFRPDPSVTKDEWLWVENHYEQIGSHRWGSLTGNISEQRDLKHELDSIKDSIKSKVDKSDNSLVRSDETTKLKVLTQAEYDALTPVADTIYFIKEA